MKLIIVTENQADQRLDKFLSKYLRKASKGFIYKMLRKKNITLNGKKADGSEKLHLKDEVRLFLSDETLEKFTETAMIPNIAGHRIPKPDIIFENRHICLMNKPSNMLSQKSEQNDISMNEIFLQYMKETGQFDNHEQGFRPSICNRLDRNTTGLIIGGKTLYGLQKMSELLKKRSVHKYYLCIVAGSMSGRQKIEGCLVKNPVTNQVVIVPSGNHTVNSSYIQTAYRCLAANGEYSLLEVQLITGRTHQIRSHLATIGHPVIGDAKYGNIDVNKKVQQKYKLKHQLLHSWRLIMPVLDEKLKDISEQTFVAPLPDIFCKIIEGENLSNGCMDFQGS